MDLILLIAAACLLSISYIMALTVAAVDPICRNIIYVHIPAAVSSLACFCILFIASIQFLRKKQMLWDNISAASAELALMFTAVLNATGMIFAKAEWGLWWTPSPRLISSVILLFLCATYLLLRASIIDPRRRGLLCAVFGIIAFVDVPIVLASARFTRDIHQPGFGFQTSWQYAALVMGISGAFVLLALLIRFRVSTLELGNKCTEITKE